MNEETTTKTTMQAMDKLAGSHNDEFYTPSYAITPLLQYLKPNSNIWCPFDRAQSHYVSTFRAAGHNVLHSHIQDGRDFFATEVPANCHYIISNPPYSIKGEVFQRLFELGIPFAMLVGVVGLFESDKRFNMFRTNMFEIMYLNRRISYFKDYNDEIPSLNPPFSSVYVCSGVLPQQIVFEEVVKPSKKKTKSSEQRRAV